MARFLISFKDADSGCVWASSVLEKEKAEDLDPEIKQLILTRYEGQLKGLRTDLPVSLVQIYEFGQTTDVTDRYRNLWKASVDEAREKYIKADREQKYKTYLELKKIFEQEEEAQQEEKPTSL